LVIFWLVCFHNLDDYLGRLKDKRIRPTDIRGIQDGVCLMAETGELEWRPSDAGKSWRDLKLLFNLKVEVTLNRISDLGIETSDCDVTALGRERGSRVT
jgi:hypothetical protein